MISLVFSFQQSSSYIDLNVSNFLGKLQAHLPIAYRKSKMSVWLSPNSKFLSVSWRNSNIPIKGNEQSYIYQPIIKHPLKGYIISSGHTHEGILNSKNHNVFPYIFELMKVSNLDIKLSDSPGGSGTYSWISPNESTLVSWNTQPPAFPLFIGKNRDDFCVVGNRALLVMIKKRGQSP